MSLPWRTLGIFWDAENCQIPSRLLKQQKKVDEISKNLIKVLENNKGFNAQIMRFRAYADLTLDANQALKYVGAATIIDTPGRKKDAAGEAITVALYEFSYDYPPPSSIVLISRDADFARVLNSLRDRGHHIILVKPSTGKVDPALLKAAHCISTWEKLINGEDDMETSTGSREALSNDRVDLQKKFVKLLDSFNPSDAGDDKRRQGLSKDLLQALSNVLPNILRKKRKLGIFWDLKDGHIPADVAPDDIYNNILTVLEHNREFEWDIIQHRAYGDLSSKQLTSIHMNVIDTPNLLKDARDIAILVALFEYAYAHRPPSSIMLISDNDDFARALHLLRAWGHDIIVAIPSGGNVDGAFTKVAHQVLKWSSVVKGELDDDMATSSSSREEVQSSQIEDQKEEDKKQKLLKLKRVFLNISRGSKLKIGNVQGAYRKEAKVDLSLQDYNALSIYGLLRMIGGFVDENGIVQILDDEQDG